MATRFEEVLEYWFDGDQADNYKTKWFPSGSSDTQSETDRFIVHKFGNLFQLALSRQLDYWTEQTKSHIALIIVLDQFSRHIYRFENSPPNSEERCRADEMALALAEKLTSNPTWDSSLSVAEFVFSLMPFRHSATIVRLTSVLARINEREIKDRERLELMEKFKKQTLRRLQGLQDRAKAEASDDILERHAFVADESDILSNPLVQSTKKFLSTHLAKHIAGSENKSVCISLSGGVDSMVIAKILAVLKENFGINTIVAIHIDYANRPESGREADFVEEFCQQLGLLFTKRTINEVTRGITDRSAYEKIARDIRYGFYQEMQREHFFPAVMFGHHIGDVQENVISNVMRGSSPLWLSGMTEVSTTNGVVVWRPLLAHHKDEIFDFAHKYGVPYFKDTTPSWSTRGKLRNQLIPLLTEMYGAGCLRNLAALATESDMTRSLVQKSIYEPFLSSVKRFPCGLSVNVMNFRDQPVCFWKEMLKELMHSMGMSLVREKAVENFMDRLHKGVQTAKSKARAGGASTNVSGKKKLNKKHDGVEEERDGGGEAGADRAAAEKKVVSAQWLAAKEKRAAMELLANSTENSTLHTNNGVVSGWIELRKGFQSLLQPDGTLVIFRECVLLNSSASGDEHHQQHSTRDERIEVTEKISISVPLPANSHQIVLTPWLVTIQQAEVSNVPTHRIFENPADLLLGDFSYHVTVPDGSTGLSTRLCLYSDTRNSLTNTAEQTVSVGDLGGMDLKLRISLPLLVPVVSSSTSTPIKLKSLPCDAFVLSYRYIGSTQHS